MKRIAAYFISLVVLLGTLSISGHAMSISYGHFNGTDEYEDFLERVNMPRNYIHASRFSLFGKLESGAMQNATRTSYSYYFSKDVTVYVKHNYQMSANGKKTLTEIPMETVTMLQMPQQPGKSSFYYFRNGLYYNYYSSGKLASLEWIANGINFKISIEKHNLWEYESVPILVRLFSISEAEADGAFMELCESAGLTPDVLHFTKRYEREDNIRRAVFVAGIAAAVALLWVTERKRRSRGKLRRKRPADSDGTREYPLTAFACHESPFYEPYSR